MINGSKRRKNGRLKINKRQRLKWAKTIKRAKELRKETEARTGKQVGELKELLATQKK